MLKVCISMICMKKIDDDYYYLIQERTNEGVKGWKGKWEFPQGSLGDHPIVNFATYKFHNETGMTLQEMLISKGNWLKTDSNTQINSCEPFIVSMESGDLALHFFVRAHGNPVDTIHAINHRWVTAKSLSELLQENAVCPLNREAFESIVRIERLGMIDKCFNLEL